MSAYDVGSLCWFPSKVQGWIGGEVIGKTINGDEVILEFRDNEGQVSYPFSLLFLAYFQ